MKDIAIYGAGGFGREVACLMRIINKVSPQWNLIGFFDDNKVKGQEIQGFGTILGGIDDLNNWSEEVNIALCFGSATMLQSISSRITNPYVKFPNIIAPDFEIGDPETFRIGKGNIITTHCGISTNVSIGNFNLFNGGIVLGHDVSIGDYNVFMPGTRISGSVTIGNKCLFGSGSFVKQMLVIPNGVTLSPLSPLLTKPKADSLYMGNPAKIVRF